jgi:putative ABC transport system ATP-binding protein
MHLAIPPPPAIASTAMSPVVLENVSKNFKQGDRSVPALKGISLDVRPGQFLAVMGASGSGKSTLLHLAAGLTLPDSGRVLVAGQDLAQLTDRALTTFRRRQIGLIFQAFNLIPSLTARENILLPLMLDGSRPDPAPVDDLLERLGMTHRADHRPDALSGGEQQRVAIGRALVANPAVILADEPTGNLDSTSGRQVCELLRDLSVNQGRTIVLVTHEPMVASHASEVAVLRDGSLVARFPVDGPHDSHDLALRYQEALR